MAKQKQWTDEDREAALGWIDRKAKTGVVFRGHDESTEAMVARLTAITELADFAEAVQTALTQAAWKRLLGALRQRKHSADDEGQDDEQGAQRDDDAGACQSCARLKAQVDSLHQQLASAINASQAKATEDGEYIEGLQGRIDWLEEVLDEHGLLDEDREPIVVQVEADSSQQDEVDRSPAPAPGSVSDRDRRIIAMKAEGENNYAIGRAIGCSEGTVRNVVKRHQAEAA